MSIKIMSQVWESGPDDRGELLVLLALADFADDRGRCWPSIATIARRARVTERSAQRILRRLECRGVVQTSEGTGPSGCNLYIIHPDTVSPPPDTRVTPSGDARVTTPLTPVSPEPLLEPSIEPSDMRAREFDLLGEKKIAQKPDRFDDFWNAYPKKAGKAAAQRAWDKVVRKHDPDAIISAAKVYAKSQKVAEGYVKHPQGWLNDARFLDPELQVKPPTDQERRRRRIDPPFWEEVVR